MNYNGMYINNDYCTCMKNYAFNSRQVNACPYLNVQYSPAALTINAWDTYSAINEESFPSDNLLGLRIRVVSIEEIMD